MGQHFLTLEDLGSKALGDLIARACELKRLRGTDGHPTPLRGKSVGILLEKSSTRTRISFEVGIAELGGLPLTINGQETQLGRGESIEDSARMFSRYLHGVVFRTHGHDRLVALANGSSIPIINGLTDRFHPCQLLADLMTIVEHRGTLKGARVAWVGDGNNMAHSWLLAAGLLGFELVIASPQGYDPEPEVVERARALGAAGVTLLRDPREACKDADVVTTDVWTSMGQEAEARRRLEAFEGYCVDSGHMALAREDSIFLHCLPAHRGEEVSAEVIDGPMSRVWDEAENRLHAQKALLEWVIAD